MIDNKTQIQNAIQLVNQLQSTGAITPTRAAALVQGIQNGTIDPAVVQRFKQITSINPQVRAGVFGVVEHPYKAQVAQIVSATQELSSAELAGTVGFDSRPSLVESVATFLS